MRRLVDIDEVIKVAENAFPQEDVRKIMWVLCHTPTAYDVEKVVAELEKQSYEIRLEGGALIGNWHSVIDTNIAIAKVRKGGVE